MTLQGKKASLMLQHLITILLKTQFAHWHWGALAIGGPVVLSDEQMAEVRAAFADYGQQTQLPAEDTASGRTSGGRID